MLRGPISGAPHPHPSRRLGVAQRSLGPAGQPGCQTQVLNWSTGWLTIFCQSRSPPTPTKGQCGLDKWTKFVFFSLTRASGNDHTGFGRVFSQSQGGLTHLCLFAHVPGEGNRVVGDLFDVSDGVEALLVVSYNREGEKSLAQHRLRSTCPESLHLGGRDWRIWSSGLSWPRGKFEISA